MENDFPTVEKVVFEEVYGKNSTDACPHTSPEEINIFNVQEIHCLNPLSTQDKLFDDEIEEQVANYILSKHKPPTYLSITDLTDSSYEFSVLLKVYRMLELRNLINYKYNVSSQNKTIETWTKVEKLKLLLAIDSLGDNWIEIEKFVGRDKGECILYFLKMDLNVTKLVHPNKRMADVIFLTSKVHPVVGSAAAKESLDLTKNPNFQIIIDKGKEQLLLEEKKLDRLKKVLLESISLRIKEKVQDFKNIINSVDKEKNEIKEEIIDHEKDIKELSEIIKEMKNQCNEL
ncbi:hypothetical protein H312_02765 [Anncaliia algerae PRA339]|uniref:SANT domain-containing protein n=1 Tax=Anncaliia algerae PRA339 TaxID=1288291 RepID=A0A059EYB2_9MICR|nr:hypothetical protein H312_02765 [Anncaliia algerae PRA339]